MRSRGITASPKRSTGRTRGETGRGSGCGEHHGGPDKRPSTAQKSTFRRVAVFVPLDGWEP